MSGFNKHIQYGFIVGILMALIFSYLSFDHGLNFINSIISGTIAFGTTVVFSTIPDVDSQHSKPRRFLETLLILVSLGVSISIVFFEIPIIYDFLYNIANSQVDQYQNIVLLLGLSISLYILLKILFMVFDSQTKHRGNFHNPFIYIILSFLIIGYSLYTGLDEITGFYTLSAGFSVIVGFFTHYMLDF